MFSEIDVSAPVYVHTGAADMRLGIDRLLTLVGEYNPLVGGYFVFFSRKKERVRILYWDRDGYCVWLKRLEVGAFKVDSSTAAVATITVECLRELLSGVELKRVIFRNKMAQKGSMISL